MSSELHKTAGASEGGAFDDEVVPNSLAHKATTLTAVLAPIAALVAAMRTSSKKGKFTKVEAAELAVLHTAAGLGVTVGLHRLFTHKSFKAKAWVRMTLARMACLSVEGRPRDWIADHRRHHAHSDQPGDPHSPNVGYEDRGVLGIFLGMIHAQFGWLLTEGTAKADRFARDLKKDEVLARADREFPGWVAFVLVAPAVVSAVAAGKGDRLAGFRRGFLWGGLVRMGLTHHITWAVNSVCHMFGKRPFKSRDKSTNNVVVALLAFGEGWHHNHHVFASSAFHGLTPRQKLLDPSGWVILFLEKTGQVWDVQRISQEEMDELRLVPA